MCMGGFKCLGLLFLGFFGEVGVVVIIVRLRVEV